MAPKLSLALSHYDRFVPLYDGSLPFEGFDVDVFHVGQSNMGRYGKDRHARMLQDGEFDVAELSLSSYVMAHDRGLPFTAIPVFPRRLFSQSQLWVNVAAGIDRPEDLVGRKVGLGTFQTTFSVLAIGDLSEEYGVPWREVEWYTDRDEVVAFDPPEGATLRRLPEGQDIGELLDQGDLAAVFRPHPPKPVLRGSKNVKRLFDDPQAEEEKYYRKNGFYPIMHLIAFRDEVLDRHPEAARVFFETFEKADEISLEYYDDPNWSRMAWGRLYFERERSILGANPWLNGIAKNRACLERFVKYSRELGLIGDVPAVESLFAASLADS